MIKEITKEFLANLGFELRKNTSIKRNKLKNFGIPRDEWESKNKGYYLKALNITIPKGASPLLDGYANAKRIVQHGKGEFFFDQQNCLQLKIKDVSFFITYPDELFVIHEVFVQGDYSFKTSDKLVVVDIGQNIGATSLYFAMQKNVHKVYAYELFPQTYQAGLKNLQLNDSSKITSFNFGLGKDNREMNVAYSSQGKARMGINGLPLDEQYKDVVNETVFIRDVAEEFNKISKLEPQIKKICKMDCEGAEFEILGQLFNAKAIGLMDVYIIEWHYEDTTAIEKKFLEHGFDFIKTISGGISTGLIYAFKK